MAKKAHRGARRYASSREECTTDGGPIVAADPVRTCVVCRAQKPPRQLIHLGHIDGCVVVKGSAGRGASVCISRGCLSEVTARHLGRAFKGSVKPLDTAAFLVDLHGHAQRQVLDTVGLGRRTGVLACGVDRLSASLADGSGRYGDTFVIVASDLSPRSQRIFPHARSFLPGDVLGKAAGLGRVGAIGIRGGQLAERAAYWLAVWYETLGVLPGDGQGAHDATPQASAHERPPDLDEARGQGLFTEVE